jgi:hypothetical protein
MPDRERSEREWPAGGATHDRPGIKLSEKWPEA